LCTEGAKSIISAFESDHVSTFQDFKDEIFKSRVNEYLKVFNETNPALYLSLSIFGPKIYTPNPVPNPHPDGPWLAW